MLIKRKQNCYLRIDLILEVTKTVSVLQIRVFLKNHLFSNDSDKLMKLG